MRVLPQFTRIGAVLFGLAAHSLSFCIASAAEPVIQKQTLFKAGENGVVLYRIPGMVVTPKGTVLAYCEARRHSRGDWGEIEVHLRRSTDGGNTWTPARAIAHSGERIEGNPHKPAEGRNEQTVNNPVAIVDGKTGVIHFLYCVNYARCFYMKSDDEGATFSAPKEITQAFEPFRKWCDWKVLATGPGHGLQLRNGRLAVPIWIAYGKAGAHAPSMSGTIYSDDQGITWQAGDIAFPNTPTWKNPNETALVELSDGSVMLNARTTANANRRLVAVSPNGATDWTIPRFDAALLDPKCMGSLLRIPSGSAQGRLLFCHPYNLKYDAGGREVPGGYGARKNLSIQISEDDGLTWSAPKTVEEGPSAYSDLGLLPDGSVLCFYECKDTLAIAHLSSEWVNFPAAPTGVGPVERQVFGGPSR
ncbi:MAG: hypothetical protein RLZZ399_1086 [Verrucomicrobiota bacterium]|jgi:sialidase-1